MRTTWKKQKTRRTKRQDGGEKTDREENEPIDDETQDNECSNPFIDVNADHVGSVSLSCNLDEVFATTESKENGEVMLMKPELLPSVYKFKGSSEFPREQVAIETSKEECA